MTSLKSNTFQGSLWLPSKSLVTPCVLYLHSSTGSRIEGYHIPEIGWSIWENLLKMASDSVLSISLGVVMLKESISPWDITNSKKWLRSSNT